MGLRQCDFFGLYQIQCACVEHALQIILRKLRGRPIRRLQNANDQKLQSLLFEKYPALHRGHWEVVNIHRDHCPQQM